MKKSKNLITSLLFIFIFCHNLSSAQPDLSYYLPQGVTYNEQIPTPNSVLGHEVGERYVSHDKLVFYFYKLAEKSSRVKVEKYGQTYEHRPLLNVIITSEENHKKLNQLRLEHLALSDPNISDKLDIEGMPVIIRLEYSVHGNEASGANASILLAYYMAAVQGREIEEILDKCIILIDPSLNPDGLQQFSTWVNSHKSKNLDADPNNHEIDEVWPNGSTNHYWFDLNKDWLLAQQPESIGRLKLFHDWLPNIQTDHHEMESDTTFSFQPGVPFRKHPLIPDENVILTKKIADYHAKAMNKEKRLYFTKDVFDGYYFGKGSTYPDFNGGIGILFAQASARGHLHETQNGLQSFPFAIKSQLISSLSNIDAAFHLRIDLLNYQRKFYQATILNNKEDETKAIIIGANDDPTRLVLLGQILLRHNIKVYKPTRDIELDKTVFLADNSLVIPLNQSQNNFIKAIFERRTSLQDSLFYDISAWNLDLSFNTDLAWINDLKSLKFLGEQITNLELSKGGVDTRSAYAYAVKWNQYFAPGLVNGLLQKGLILKVATEPFTARSGQSFERGTVLIPTGIQNISEREMFELIEQSASKFNVNVNGITSDLSSAGIDLDSSGFCSIQKPIIAMLVDESASGYDAGEIWHLLDQRYDMHVTMISSGVLDKIKLSRYNVLILPGGSYSNLNVAAQGKIKNWVKNGGTIIACQDALRLISKLQLADLKFKKTEKNTSTLGAYGDQHNMHGGQIISAAIFNMEIDNIHPLAYGYAQKKIPVLKQGTLFLQLAANSIANPFRYTTDPLLSGYTSDENLKLISGSPAVSVAKFGEGKVIAFTDNYNFRAVWLGTNRLFMNGIFFGDLLPAP